VLAQTGWCVATSEEIAPRHPEKVLMVRSDFAGRAAEEHLALVAALTEACEFCAGAENRERLSETLAQPEYVGAPIEALRMSLCGTFDYGHGRIEKHSAFHLFAGEGVNEPGPDKAEWIVRGLLTTGLVPESSLVPRDRVKSWFRSDLFRRAQRLRGVRAAGFNPDVPGQTSTKDCRRSISTL
jgi:ABC-type nitrate/sulfonate/bicarbonate transport system substrate-binding protein